MTDQPGPGAKPAARRAPAFAHAGLADDAPVQRLLPLWFPAIEASADDADLALPQQLADELPDTAGAVQRVLLTRGLAPAPARLAGGLLQSCAGCSHVYQLDAVAVGHLDELATLCDKLAPRVVVIDLRLIEADGAAGLQQLRRHLPAVEWLLACDSPETQPVETAVLLQVRGCIRWEATPSQLASALDAVVAGRLWFPRQVLEALYASLLHGDLPLADVLSGPGPADALTLREAEVLGLMRKGLTNRQIAERLDISPNTVKKHIASVLIKRGLHGRRQVQV